MSTRQRIVLDGPWHFYYDAAGDAQPDEVVNRAGWRTATVPMPWQAQFEDLRNRGGIGWYRRTLDLPAIADEQVAVLHFGAVDYHATVWVNGVFVCEHEGGYLPFDIDITPHLTPGDNEVLVRVLDPDDDSAEWAPYAFSQIPHGKQSWYGQTSGIWQSVWLEVRNRCHVRRLMLTPDLARGEIAVEAPLTNAGSAEALTVHLAVFGPDGELLKTEQGDGRGFGDTAFLLTLDAPVRPWSPDDPALYRVRLQLHRHGQVLDEIEDLCGFRTVEARSGRVYLNGRPIYLRGALDQAYYPETIYTPSSLEMLERQFRQAKELGFNCLRCHIKIEDPRYYALADRLGILIWAELPNWMHLSPAAATRAEETFAAMVERDWNHPSIIVWTLVNEDWGTDLVHDDEHRQWLLEFFHQAKALDPTRLIVDNSPCHPNAHIISDLEDYHHYRVIPDNAAAWTQWVADFAARPDWAWVDDYAHLRQADAPLIVSEFGNWGLPDPAQLIEDEAEPWWFDTGYDWGEGIVTPRGLEQRFLDWRLDRTFGTFAAFLHASQQQMARSLAYEISAIRSQAAMGGYVVTELTDIYWEANGLLDFQRNVKAGMAERVATVNHEHAVLIEPETWSAEVGEAIRVRFLAVDGTGPARRGRLRWRTEQASGEVSAPGDTVLIPMPPAGESCLVSVQAEWVEDDRVLAANRIELTCLAIPPWDGAVHFAGDPALALALRDAGYEAATGASDARLLITDNLSDAMLGRVRNGAQAVWFVDARAEPAAPMQLAFLGDQTRILAREGTWWQGDWASSCSWLRKTGPFAHLPGDPMLEMAFADIMPRHVLTLETHRLLKQNIWAGLAVGWLQKVVGLIAYMDYGRGSLVICTMRLTPDRIRANATARAVVRGLTALAATGGR